jgi:hypothetical protein
MGADKYMITLAAPVAANRLRLLKSGLITSSLLLPTGFNFAVNAVLIALTASIDPLSGLKALADPVMPEFDDASTTPHSHVGL